MHNNTHIKTIIYIYYYSTAKETKKVENATYYTILRFQPYYIYQSENWSDYTILTYRITR